eukprot:366559-Chlamydomonas_euryale.AAC.3
MWSDVEVAVVVVVVAACVCVCVCVCGNELVTHTYLPIFLSRCETWTWTEVQMRRLEVTHSNCLHRIVGVKLKDRHRLVYCDVDCTLTIGTSSLELMVRRRTLQWMGHVLQMDEDRLPRQVLDCSLARSFAEEVGPWNN